MQVQKKQKKETFVYLVLWTILFLAPLLSTYIDYTSDTTGGAFPWHEVWLIWRQYCVFLIVFLIHNYLLAPLLVYRQKRLFYGIGFALLLSAFVVVQCVDKPTNTKPHPRFHQMHRPPHRDEFRTPPDGQFHKRPDHRPDDLPMMRGHKPPVREHDVVAVIIFFLMIGLNLGVKYYFRQSQDRERLAQLERENLEQQLEYLKYQINPHFLMNTLNNIHALVDIDPEQAKETIVELSKIMRFVLYEGSKQKVPLRKEMIFLDNYIQLMRMRVADQVDISVDIPQAIPDKDIPPLMMITFVENAFKHGVSYQQHSFIDISIQIVDNQLHFRCRNSKVPQGEDHHGGVGLQNVKQRLQLIYGSTYTLNIKDEAETYTVDLTLPL